MDWYEDQELRTEISNELLAALRDADGIIPVTADEVRQAIQSNQVQALIERIDDSLGEAAAVGF